MLNKNNTFVPKDLDGKSDNELLKYFDNPRNFKVKDCRNDTWENSDAVFPKHCLVFLTHGSFAVNEKIRRTTKLTKHQFLRLMRNFSDFGTRKMTKKSGIPETNIITFPGSRATGDPNREYRCEDQDSKLDIGKKFIRDVDFNGQEIITKPGQFREKGKYKHDMYHGSLDYNLQSLEKQFGGVIGIDIHDTGVNLMDKDSSLDRFRKEGFPEITLGTKNGESCNNEILEYFSQKLNNYLGLKVHVNKPYQGGYVTTKHGKEKREKINNGDAKKKYKRNMIQVELGRYLYMKESTQEIDWERMEIIGEGIKRAITDTGIKFGEKYFESIKK